jgi:uncharacterized DUF497 family protein
MEAITLADIEKALDEVEKHGVAFIEVAQMSPWQWLKVKDKIYVKRRWIVPKARIKRKALT